MSTTTDDVLGPIDFLLIECDIDRMNGEAAAALADLVDRGIVRVYDLLLIRKEADGSVDAIDIADTSDDALGGFGAFAGARSGLVSEQDIIDAGDAMEPGTAAALIIYENAWAEPFVAAAHRAGAQVIASARIPASDLLEVLDHLDQHDPIN
jgi:hypothetical protein